MILSTTKLLAQLGFSTLLGDLIHKFFCYRWPDKKVYVTDRQPTQKGYAGKTETSVQHKLQWHTKRLELNPKPSYLKPSPRPTELKGSNWAKTVHKQTTFFFQLLILWERERQKVCKIKCTYPLTTIVTIQYLLTLQSTRRCCQWPLPSNDINSKALSRQLHYSVADNRALMNDHWH